VDVILPAGGRLEGQFAAEGGTQIKALLSVGGRSVLERILDALLATGRIERTVVIGPDELAGHPAADGADVVLPETDSGPGNIFRGLEWLRQNASGGIEKPVLIVATDLPFLRPKPLVKFIDACPPDADVCVPITTKDAFEARFPGGPSRRYTGLREGPVTVGCAFVVDPDALMRNRRHLERIFALRKSAFSVLAQLGVGFVARLLLGRLTVADIQRRAEEILQCRTTAVLDSPPELAFDIDRLDDYRYVLAQEG